VCSLGDSSRSSISGDSRDDVVVNGDRSSLSGSGSLAIGGGSTVGGGLRSLGGCNANLGDREEEGGRDDLSREDGGG
jgi:hypothetical protein